MMPLIRSAGPDVRGFKAAVFTAVILAGLMAVCICSDAGRALADMPSSGLIRVRAEISVSGIYRITADDLAGLLNLSAADIRSLISNRRFQVVNMGKRVDARLFADGGGFYFYGTGISNQFTDINVFWLNFFTGPPEGDITGDGAVDEQDVSAGLDLLTGKQDVQISPYDGAKVDMARLAAAFNAVKTPPSGRMAVVFVDAPAFSAPGRFFHDVAHAEEDLYDMTADATDPDDDYWFWDFVFAGDPQSETRVFPVFTPGASPAGDAARLAVYLKGAANVPGRPDHHVVISLNGNYLGEGFFDGTEAYKGIFDVDPTILADGENTVSVTGLLEDGVAWSAFAVDSFDLSYPREYRAKNNVLTFIPEANDAITVTGFTGGNIILFDISDPVHPTVVNGAAIYADTEGFSLSFIPAGPDTVYLALTSQSALFPKKMEVSAFSDLRHRSAQYLVITPDRLAVGAGRLAEYRKTRGFSTLLARLPDVFDQFSFGIHDPRAIHDFIAHAARNWDTPPSFVVLVGDGTYDYKDILGAGDNCVPVIMKQTPYGLAASDFSYTDVNDDGVPDIPIGRIPVSTLTALNTFIDRIEAHEAALLSRAGSVIMAADKKDPDAGDFPSDSDNLSLHVLSPWCVKKIYLSQMTAAAARQSLIDSINSGHDGSGVFLVNYIGHGGITQLSSSGILRNVDAASLSNAPPYPLLVTMTCIAGQFQNPGYPSLAEAMITRNTGGFAAAFAPSGLSLNVDAVIINRNLFDILFSQQEAVIGPAVLEALRQYAREGNFEYMRWIYNLLGDPAMRIAM